MGRLIHPGHGGQSREGKQLLRINVLCLLLSVLLVFSSVSAAFAAGEDQTRNVTVPDVTRNYTLADAVNTLESQGFKWQVAEGNSNYTGATVIATNPWGGTSVPYGSTVTLYTEEQETVIDEMCIGFWKQVPQEDGTTKNEFVRFPSTYNPPQEPWIETKNGSVSLGLSVKWRGQDWSNAGDSLTQGDVRYGSSDEGIATVDRNGVVTATGAKDGDVTITCTLTNNRYTPSTATTQIYAQIVVHVIGQAGAYPIEVVIVNEDNTPIGANDLIVDASDGTAQYDLYARVLYSDRSQKCNAPNCDPRIYTAKIDGLTWSVDDTRFASVDEQTGIVVPMPNISGKTAVVASVAGGKDGPVRDSIYLNIKGMSTAPPSSSLNAHVYYESDPDNEVSSKVYTPSSLMQASSTGSYVQQPYTQVRSTGGWRTVSGEGVWLKDICEDLGITDTSQIKGLICKATDGTNNGFVPGSVLFGQTNYYFPNFDSVNSSGVHNTSGAYQVFPMIAIKSYQADESTKTDFANMNSDNCFELLLGNHGSSNGTNGDMAAHYSLYKMYDVQIVLNGSPKVDYGKNPGGGDEVGGNGNNNGDGGAGNEGDNENGAGQGGSGDNNDGQGGDEGSGEQGNRVVLGVGGDPTDASLNDAASESGADASQMSSSVSEDEGEADETAEEEVSDETPLPDTSDRWQVFEMMSRDKNDLNMDYNNPLEPFFIPGCCAVALAGSLGARDNLKNEMGNPTRLRRALRRLRKKA